MNEIDLLIILWLVFAVVRGFSVGFLRQAFSFGGFLAGLMLGGWLSPYISELSTGTPPRLLVTLMVTLILALGLALVGEKAAIRVQASHKIELAHKANSFLGVFLGGAFVLFSSWLIASTLIRLPFANVGLVVDESKVVQTMNKVLPPAPLVMERIGQLISPEGFPQVFVGPEPDHDPAGPPSTPEVEAAAQRARDSMARIEGFACGGISVGSGFVVAPRYLVTNAHVVAGIRQPVIFHQDRRYRATVVFFDSNRDLAVLRTASDLPGEPLALADDYVARGTTTAVLGYPGGGGLTVSPGVILRSQVALGRDIYNARVAAREVYALDANVRQGNSGGPVVLPDGRVAGVIFGSAVRGDDIGYALSSPDIADDVREASQRDTAVSTGPCLTD